MVFSGSIALFIGYLPFDWGLAIGLLALLWGATIVADSAQFSTAATELCDPAYRGTILTAQTGLGFALTAITIRLVPVMEDSVGWGLTFTVLAIGPLIGTLAMLRLRSLPEAARLAGGNR